MREEGQSLCISAMGDPKDDKQGVKFSSVFV